MLCAFYFSSEDESENLRSSRTEKRTWPVFTAQRDSPSQMELSLMMNFLGLGSFISIAHPGLAQGLVHRKYSAKCGKGAKAPEGAVSSVTPLV